MNLSSPSPLQRRLAVAWALGAALALGACGRAPSAVDAITAPSRHTHEPYFPIEAGKHAGIDCNKCHGGFATFRDFDCLGCHADPTTTPGHASVSGYAWDNPACYSCHPQGVANGAGDHARYFPIAAGAKHAGIACATCHVAPADRKQVDCTGCHEHSGPAMAHVHLDVGGYEFDSAHCLRCHADSQTNRVADHSRFLIGAGAKHFQQSCLRCHAQLRADKPFGAEFRQSDCLGCHTQPTTDPPHAGLAGYGWENPKCLSCHPVGEGAAIDHKAFFPIAAGDKHAAAACATCHTDPTNRKVVTCTGCHAAAAMNPKHTKVGGFANDSALCLRCHADSQVTRVAAHGSFRVDTGSSHFQKSCLQCHTRARTDKSWGADFKQSDCLGCHTKPATDPPHAGISGYAFSNPQCLSCHPAGEGAAVDHAKYFPITTGTKHAAATCVDCHTAPSNRKVITCTGCHPQGTMATDHRRIGDYAWTSSLCMKCHADSQVDTLSSHSCRRGEGHEGASCFSCHTTMRSDKPWGSNFNTSSCTTCHRNRGC